MLMQIERTNQPVRHITGHLALREGQQLGVSLPIMGKNNRNEAPFDLGCPHCGANLKVDPEMKAVIAHTPPVRPKTFNDFEEATRAMKEQDSRRESLFQQSVAAQKNSADLLEKKFQEAMKRAKETPDTGKPLRDIDLG
jgi:protein-disulfide isomerase